MERIQAQASKLGSLIFDPKTAEAYKTTFALTWSIIKETGFLLWLLFCFVFVIGAWIANTALQAGHNFRAWIDNQGQQKDEGIEPSEKVAATGKALLSASQNGATFLLAQARDQLGLAQPEVSPLGKPAAASGAAPSMSQSKVPAPSQPPAKNTVSEVAQPKSASTAAKD